MDKEMLEERKSNNNNKKQTIYCNFKGDQKAETIQGDRKCLVQNPREGLGVFAETLPEGAVSDQR